MTTNPSLLRADAREIKPAAFALTDRQRERQENIVEIATILLAKYGTQNITFTNLAIGLRLTNPALRFHFTDLLSLLAEILARHLNAIAAALGAVPHDAPNRHQALRAAYLAATRAPAGGLNDPHTLLLRDRHLLPPDLLQSIDLTRQGFAIAMAGDLADEALCLLDNPALGATRIEARLAPPAPQPIMLPPQRPRPAPARPNPQTATEIAAFPPLRADNPNPPPMPLHRPHAAAPPPPN